MKHLQHNEELPPKHQQYVSFFGTRLMNISEICQNINLF